MAQYTAKTFGGSTPRVAEHLLGESTAAEALDCKLWHGTLESWREPLLIRAMPALTKTTYLYDCCWLDFGSCVDIAFGPVTCREIFTTGDQDWPAAVEFGANCVPTIRRLGVPCADRAPSVVTPAVTPTKDTEGRAYAYQYVNGHAERGALSKASAAQLVNDGQASVISGWEVPDASWGVTGVRIYRSVAGYQSGREQGNVFDTVWMYVGEAPIGAPSFVDSLYNEQLVMALEEDIADPPPAALKGIVHIASMNCLAGFVGNRVFFSENNSYHQWPYHIDLDDNVCALLENNGVLYAATDGNPYAIMAAVDCKNAGCREAIRLPVKFPMTGCGNRRMGRLPQGAVYPTHDGLVALNGNSLPQLITTPLYAPDDWHKLYPETITPVGFNGMLFVFGRGGSFVLRLTNGPEAGWALDGHSTLSDTGITDAFVSRTGDFYIAKQGSVYQWDRGATLRPHKWVSPEIVTPVPLNFGAAHLQNFNGAETVKITADGRTVINRAVLAPRVFRLPNWAEGTRWQATLTGTATVKLFSMATSMHELGA